MPTELDPVQSKTANIDGAAFLAGILTLFLTPVSFCFGVEETQGEWMLLILTVCDGIMALSLLSGFVAGFVFLAPHECVWVREMDPSKAWWHFVFIPRAFRLVNSALDWLDARGANTSQGYRLPIETYAATRPAAGWFWVDVLTVFPSELLLAGARGAGGGGGRDFLRLTQILKMARLARVMESFASTRRQLISGSLNAWGARTVVLVLLILHWAACAWYLAASREFWRENDGGARRSCAVRGDVRDGEAPHSFRYLCGVHFSLQIMSTVGFGNMPVAGSRERIYVTAAIVIGIGVSVYVVRGILQLLESQGGGGPGGKYRLDLSHGDDHNLNHCHNHAHAEVREP